MRMPLSMYAALAALLVLPALGHAADAPSKGDAAKGKDLAYTCQGCHGITGYKNAYPNYHVPMIAGQSEQYLHNALMDYKAGKRKHPTMNAQAQSFSDADLANLAAYLSSLKTK